MLISAPQLGFSITSPFKAIARVGTRVAKGVYSTARDPNVQAAAVAAAQQYAPGQYAQVTQQANRYVQQGRQIQQILRPPGAPPPMMPPPPMPDGGDDGAPEPGQHIKTSHGLFTFAAIAGAGLIVVLLLKK